MTDLIDSTAHTVQLSEITEALERAWQTLQFDHSDIRDAVLVVYQHPKGDRRGHYGHDSWTIKGDIDNPDGQPELDTRDEVYISSHILAEGARSVLETLLHEAVHSIAQARSIKDTSRQGRWHNKRFEAIAKTLGLICKADKSIGCITPDITDETAEEYAELIADLDPVLTLYQPVKTRVSKPRAKPVKLECAGCGAKLSVSQKVLDAAELTCLECGEPFEAI